MRWIECEGGPYDGRRIEVINNAHIIEIPMQSHREILTYTKDSSVPAMRKRGMYQEDPLDPATFIWMGEP